MYGDAAPTSNGSSHGSVTEGALINLNANDDQTTVMQNKNMPSLSNLPPVPPRSFENGIKTWVVLTVGTLPSFRAHFSSRELGNPLINYRCDLLSSGLVLTTGTRFWRSGRDWRSCCWKATTILILAARTIPRWPTTTLATAPHRLHYVISRLVHPFFFLGLDLQFLVSRQYRRRRCSREPRPSTASRTFLERSLSARTRRPTRSEWTISVVWPLRRPIPSFTRPRWACWIVALPKWGKASAGVFLSEATTSIWKVWIPCGPKRQMKAEDCPTPDDVNELRWPCLIIDHLNHYHMMTYPLNPCHQQVGGVSIVFSFLPDFLYWLYDT